MCWEDSKGEAWGEEARNDLGKQIVEKREFFCTRGIRGIQAFQGVKKEDSSQHCTNCMMHCINVFKICNKGLFMFGLCCTKAKWVMKTIIFVRYILLEEVGEVT